MFANNNLGVVNLSFPDVCITPPPIPYVNIAISVTHIPSQMNVFIGIGIAENLATQGTVSNGDNSGVLMGVVSHIIMGPDRAVLGSFVTFICAIPASRLTSLTIQNLTNGVGLSLTPAQLVTCLAG